MILTPNMSAFLATIRASEGTAKAADPYAVTFGEQYVITDFSDHPALKGWGGYLWKGIHETAAGAYQITKGTWLDIKKAINPVDFSPFWQDQGAAWLVTIRGGAEQAIDAGDFGAAVAKCSQIWASLPGSTSGQPQARLADLENIYAAAGGKFS